MGYGVTAVPLFVVLHFPAMRKLILYVLLFCVVFAALSGAAIFIGRQQPPPARVAALHLTDCAPPCWIGIEPGKTTIAEAKMQIESIFENSTNPNLNETDSVVSLEFRPFGEFQPGNEPRIMLVAKKDNIVREIRFYFTADPSLPISAYMPRLAELYCIFGEPDRIVWQHMALGGPGLFYGSEDYGATIHIPLPYRLNLETQPILLDFHGRGGFYEVGMGRRFYPWRGLAAKYTSPPTE